MKIDVSTTLGTLVEEIPGASQVMDEVGLNYCCGGHLSLDAACRNRFMDVQTMAARLEALAGVSGRKPDLGWFGRPVSDLVDYLERPQRISKLKRLRRLADEVLIEHGEDQPELQTVHRLVHYLAVELEGHLPREEKRLFSSIRRPEPHRSEVRSATLLDVARDHEHIAELLRYLRAFTHGYTVPEGVSYRYHRLYRRLAALDRFLRERLHLVNNVLIPQLRQDEAGT